MIVGHIKILVIPAVVIETVRTSQRCLDHNKVTLQEVKKSRSEK